MKKSYWLCPCMVVAVLAATALSAPEVPTEAQGHYEAGIAAKQAGKLQDAAKELGEAIQLAPKWVDARWALAWTYAGLKDTQPAVAAFNWVIHLAPGTKQAEDAKAAIQRLGGEVKPPREAAAPVEPVSEATAAEPATTQPRPMAQIEAPGVRTLPHSAQVNSIAFSPDGALLACATGETLFSATQDETGQQQLVPEAGNELRLWDARTWTLKQTLKPHPFMVSWVAFSPDGKTLATSSTDETVKLWDVATGRLLRTLAAPTFVFGQWLAFSPDGGTLAVAGEWKEVEGGGEGLVQLWDVRTGELRQELTASINPTFSVAFSPDGKFLVGGSAPITLGEAELGGPTEMGELHLWDLATGEVQRKLTGHPVGLRVSFSPDGKTVATGGLDEPGAVLLWDVETGAVKQAPARYSHPVMAVAFSPDGTLLASACEDEGMQLLDAQTGEVKRTLAARPGEVLCVAFSPDGKTLAVAREETVRLWDLSQAPETTTQRLDEPDIPYGVAQRPMPQGGDLNVLLPQQVGPYARRSIRPPRDMRNPIYANYGSGAATVFVEL
ncbi:MAG: WD40 repeat domain-containing protein, partial [Armatimonadota bacterium]